MNLLKAYVNAGKATEASFDLIGKAPELIKTETSVSRPAKATDEEWQKMQQENAELSRCDVESLFRSVIGDLAGPVEGRRVQIDVQVEPDACVLRIDSIKFHDALRNLLENAVNYSPDGGHIELAARVTGPHVAFTVADEGPGIPEADLTRVFERFYRVDKSRSRDAGGTGLGLSIVKHLVELHGGTVRAGNKPTGGAIFTIELPVASLDAETLRR